MLRLEEPSATDVWLTGVKAANLAHAAGAGLATLPGVVLTTVFTDSVDQGAALTGHPVVRQVFNAAEGSTRPLVARSSSVAEDTAESSMAGQFESVVDIHGLEAFEEAVDEVLASRSRTGTENEPIAVLVQPFLEPVYGGVLFGIDPVTGRSDRRVIAAVEGAPVDLVSGEVDGARYLVSDRGEVLEHERNDGADLGPEQIGQLVDLAARVSNVFGGPQDIEWAIDRDGRLWLLQSRPVTTEARGVPSGPVYGPGPIAETFPEPLSTLESDLWIPPLRSAVRATLRLIGAATDSELDASEIVVDIGGHVAIDLALAGEIGTPATRPGLNPLSAARHLGRTWRLGRLRAALPHLAASLLDRADRDLEALPALGELTDRQLLAVLHRTRAALHAVHAHEILMGMLTDTGETRMTGASLALRILVEARRDGITDAEIVRRSPAVLALTAPRIGPGCVLPPDPTAVDLGGDSTSGNDNGLLREALRLRVRWLQELSGRVAWELGQRLHRSGDLPSPEAVRLLTVGDLDAVVTKRSVVVTAVLDALSDTNAPDTAERLPARFRITDRGLPLRVRLADEIGGGTGAGGGVATGPVTYDAVDPPSGAILVTSTLTPGLGPVLGRLAGLVSETGSVLSHLAILAREAGVATVVGYASARSELAEGTIVSVDGLTGQVVRVPRAHTQGVDP